MSQVAKLAESINAQFRGESLSEDSSVPVEEFLLSKLAAHRRCVPVPQQQEAQKELLVNIIDACLSEQVILANSRVVLHKLVHILEEQKDHLSNDTQAKVLRYLLDKIRQRLSSYEGVIFDAIDRLAAVLEEDELWEEAARQLQSIQFERSQRQYDADYKFKVYVHTMELFLMAEKPELATSSLNRAAALLPEIQDKHLIIRYRFCQARILDSINNYIEAATAYQNVGQSEALPKEQRNMAMASAINCAVLASAGPQRVRVLSRLYHDKLASDIPTFSLLEKMFLKRLIKPDEFRQFEEGLEPHQRALLPDGKTTKLTRAVREHNMLVLSSLYSNIKFENLGRSLDMDADAAEEMCATMIAEGRMKGRIDQIESAITFDGAREVKEVTAAISMKKVASEQPPPMYLRETVAAKWDQRIMGLCQNIEDAVDKLIERQPVYARALFRNTN
ncbi:hypothetical protein GQ54DRAFT_295982 [Martensiomyces pterosporus]|nr:hypothetical protein GQ54DRAFT_295982 [Martensiomyces pterosporus]